MLTTATRLALLQSYRHAREAGNTNPFGEATGRIYLQAPEALKAAGQHAEGVDGFVRMFRQMLEASPVVIRRGELLVGNYYYMLPYEIIPINPPVDMEALNARGAQPGVPSGHTSMDVPRGLALGWKGLLALIAASRARFADGTPQAEYLDGQTHVVAAIQEHIRAYARAAARLAESAADPEQAQEYQEIAARCLRLAEEPPLSFHDALQWYFFYIIFSRATSTGLGGVRIDQVFYPFYLRDRQVDQLDDDQARLLLECLFMKEVPFCSLGGVTPQGENAENELTVLALVAYDTIGGTGNLYVRWHPEINPRLLALASDILARKRSGTPSIVNDTVIISSLVHFGYPLEYARDYNFSGCFWWAVPGREYSCHDLPAIDGARALLRALAAVRANPPADFEALWQVYMHYLGDAIDALMGAYAAIDPWLAQHYPEMVLSLLMDGCLEQGRDVNNNGVEFSLTTVMYVGLATVADSLYALKKRVYDEQVLTLEQVAAAIEANFVGFEKIHRLLHSVPKYGNDDPGADAMAVQVAEQFKKALIGRKNSKGFGLRPAFYSYLRHTFEGSLLGATPDGRRAGAPLSHGVNPAHGSAHQGITAAIHSMTAFRYDDTAGGPVHLHLHASQPQEAAETIQALVTTAMSMGAVHLIINIVDGEILRAAMQHPEEYADLTIRVTGYSARFVQLERRLQEEIALRDSY